MNLWNEDTIYIKDNWLLFYSMQEFLPITCMMYTCAILCTCTFIHVNLHMYICTCTLYTCVHNVQYYVHVHIYVYICVHVHCVPASIMFHNDSLQNVVQSIDLWSSFHYNCTSCTWYWQLYNWCCNVWCSSLDFKVHKLSLWIRKYQPHVLVLIMMGWGAMVML